MMKLFSRICAVILIVAGTTALCHARTAYVSDVLILTLKQGPGPSHRVISKLKSDTPLTIIEENNGYFKVQVPSGKQGWVDKKYVMFDPPKSMVIDQLKKENAALEDKIRGLTKQSDGEQNTGLAANPAAMDQLKKENKALTQNIETLKSQYTALKAASSDVAATLEENKRLKTRNESLSAKLGGQEENNGFIFKTGMIKWFLAGVGVLLLGWGIGLSISSRKGGSGSLLD